MGYYHLGVYYNNTDQSDSAFHYYLLVKDMFGQISNINKVLTVNHGLAILDYSAGNYDEAIERLKSNVAINLEDKYDTLIDDKLMNLALAYDLMGNSQLFKGNHHIALDETLKALHILDSLEAAIRRADALNHLGSIEFYLNNYDNTIKYNKEALEVYRQYNDKFYEAQVLNDIGNTYYYLEEYDSAIAYMDRAVELSREISSKALEGTALNNLGKYYQKLGEFDKSIAHSTKALDIHKTTGSQNKIVESLGDIGMAYNAMGQYGTAISYFNQSLQLAINIGVKENIRINYFNRSISYEKLGNYSQALMDFKAYKNVEDSIFSESKLQQIEELRTIYETEKNEKEIALQRSQIQLLEQQNKISKLQKTFLAVAVLVSLVLLGVVYFALRQKIKRRQLEKEVLNKELRFKRKELTTHALHLANKSEILEALKTQIGVLKADDRERQKGLNRLENAINLNLKDDKSWDNFRSYFEEVYKDFNRTIKQRYPEATTNELRLMALLKMNLSSKGIANILNISNEGIKKARYRLRKKLNISNDESLNDLMLCF